MTDKDPNYLCLGIRIVTNDTTLHSLSFRRAILQGSLYQSPRILSRRGRQYKFLFTLQWWGMSNTSKQESQRDSSLLSATCFVSWLSHFWKKQVIAHTGLSDLSKHLLILLPASQGNVTICFFHKELKAREIIYIIFWNPCYYPSERFTESHLQIYD